MKTLKVEEVYISGYETFGDVVMRWPRFIEDVYRTRSMAGVAVALAAYSTRRPCHFKPVRSNPYR